MNFKSLTVGLFLVLSLSMATSAQQATKADIQALEGRMSALEARVAKLEIAVSNLEITVRELDKRLTNKIEELDKRLTVLMNILIGVVLAAIALPQVLGYLQGKRGREEIQKQIQDLGQRLERQQQEILEKLSHHHQEIEALKSRRIVTAS